MRSGEEAKARKMIFRVLEVAEITRLSTLSEIARDWETKAYAILGDVANTLEAMKRSFDGGASPFMFELRDEFKPFLNLPEYQAISSPRKAELAIQSNRIREMKVEGELGVLP